MNTAHIIINQDKKTIGIDLIGCINNIDLIIKMIHNRLKTIDKKYDIIHLDDWKINIFTQHARIYSKEEGNLFKLTKHCQQYNTKQLDIIVAIPQKVLKNKLSDYININNMNIKLFTSNKIN